MRNSLQLLPSPAQPSLQDSCQTVVQYMAIPALTAVAARAVDTVSLGVAGSPAFTALVLVHTPAPLARNIEFIRLNFCEGLPVHDEALTAGAVGPRRPHETDGALPALQPGAGVLRPRQPRRAARHRVPHDLLAGVEYDEVTSLEVTINAKY